MSLFQMIKMFLKKNKREILRLVGLLLFLSFFYVISHILMPKEGQLPLPVVVIIEDTSEEDTETDLRFPVMEETEKTEQTEQTETTVYEQIKTVKKTSERENAW